MICEFGDVILVRFPFTDQIGFKQRPAVVVSSQKYNESKPDVIIAAVTSQLRATAAFGEVWISEWEAAHLLKPSAVKPVFATIETGLVVRRLGALSAPDQASLRASLSVVLG